MQSHEPGPLPLVSIVTVVFRAKQDLSDLIDSVLQFKGRDH